MQLDLQDLGITGQDVVDQLESVVHTLRSLVFELTPPATAVDAVDGVLAVVHNAGRVLGFAPTLTVTGPATSLPADVAGHLVAVLQECLSNTARHAAARSVDISVAVGDGRARLRVTSTVPLPS